MSQGWTSGNPTTLEGLSRDKFVPAQSSIRTGVCIDDPPEGTPPNQSIRSLVTTRTM